MGASAAVLGASGYAGAEVLRLLARHPAISVVAVAAGSREGRRVGDVLPHLSGEIDLELTSVEEAAAAADVCFSCLPHGTLPALLDAVAAEVVVDLGDDYRAAPGWAYGLPELARPRPPPRRIANPGCYPTATLLCLVPFARAGAIDGTVVVDALSGVSGAGRAAEDRLLFANVTGGASAYGTVAHRHVAEIERGLALFGSLQTRVSFTPHLVPMARGLLVTARARVSSPIHDDVALQILQEAYADEPFVHVLPEGRWPRTADTLGANTVHLQVAHDARSGRVVVVAAVDNLTKGTAGAAVQCMNLALGLAETTGLPTIGLAP